jgi:hypothetical protein
VKLGNLGVKLVVKVLVTWFNCGEPVGETVKEDDELAAPG